VPNDIPPAYASGPFAARSHTAHSRASRFRRRDIRRLEPTPAVPKSVNRVDVYLIVHAGQTGSVRALSEIPRIRRIGKRPCSKTFAEMKFPFLALAASFHVRGPMNHTDVTLREVCYTCLSAGPTITRWSCLRIPPAPEIIPVSIASTGDGGKHFCLLIGNRLAVDAETNRGVSPIPLEEPLNRQRFRG